MTTQPTAKGSTMKLFFKMLLLTALTTSAFSAWLSPPWYGILGIALHFGALYSIAYGVHYE